ncbi:hypothetical protein EYR36_008861 [Pleurotus pulmonarius]|nr:hypothetical protein EYR36_008861 [Pleurotus pulmonarius]
MTSQCCFSRTFMDRLKALAFTTSLVALVYFFTQTRFTLSSIQWPSSLFGGKQQPDFSLYKSLSTLSVQEFPLDPAQSRRTVIIGDIHGMNNSLSSLLDGLDYHPGSDVLIHVGDIIAKGPHEGSMAVLSYMASHNITGIRGNHDQKVIEWRGWLDWLHRFPDGRKWLTALERRWDEAAAGGADPGVWASKQMKRHRSPWWRTIPKDWKIFTEHYKIARAMSDAEYRYLLSLPLVLHIPHAHTFVVHAGLLSSDPRYKPRDPRQPLARVPTVFGSAKSKHGSDVPKLRRAQELALLSDIEQNTDPWVKLNMRGVLKNHDVTRGKDGRPWSDIWNRDMSRCGGFEHDLSFDDAHTTPNKHKMLPCHPSTVVYGHAASRGLDIKRWTVGLDAGCVYGRKLSGLVLGRHKHNDLKKHQSPTPTDIPFGDNFTGHVVDTECQLE